METKMINIAVPISWTAPDIMCTLNAEENAFILNTGSEMIKEARSLVTCLSQKEVYNKIREESKLEIQKLEMDLLVQKKLIASTNEQTSLIYESQITRLQTTINELTTQLNEHVNNSKRMIQQEVDKEKEKLKIVLEDKNKQVLRITENYEKFLRQTETKSSKKLGDEGEDNFMLLSDTFKDFIGYKIENKSHQAHKGDFHLFFENFNVLVDLKNYKGSVQKKELDKIEHDLSINDTMDFAWLISYESNVSDWSRFPIMCKWIVTEIGLKCIMIVNNLNSNKNPTDVLRTVWNMTNEIHAMLRNSKEMDNSELKKMKERDYNVLQKIKTAHKRLSEMKRNVASMSQIAKDIENDIIDAISMFTNELTKNDIDKGNKVKEWWASTVTYTGNNENKLTSTEVWSRFKKDNKQYVDENNLLIDDFKKHLKNVVDVNNYIEKSKKGLVEFVGFVFNDLLVCLNSESEKVGEQLEVELNISNGCEKNPKVVKKKSITQFVISEEVDGLIAEEYSKTGLNVLDIAKNNNLLVWQVVSILMKKGLIKKRSDVRVYEIYKETDEYKSKFKKT